jgi:hypothetical protein
LYGLGKAEIPSVNTLAPLKPQVAAQKPEGGLQHPNGDALNVSETYKAADGREIEIYIQDVYPSWPYDSLGINDYLRKVEQVVSQAIASPICMLRSGSMTIAPKEFTSEIPLPGIIIRPGSWM